jgi:hypothetical protein
MTINTQSNRTILIILIVLAAIPFFFVKSSISHLGISLFAWLLVGVMILTPIITLVDLLLNQEREQ